MSTPALTEPDLVAFGYVKMVPIDSDRKPYWEHPSYGRFYVMPTRRALLDYVFSLGWDRSRQNPTAK